MSASGASMAAADWIASPIRSPPMDIDSCGVTVRAWCSLKDIETTTLEEWRSLMAVISTAHLGWHAVRVMKDCGRVDCQYVVGCGNYRVDNLHLCRRRCACCIVPYAALRPQATTIAGLLHPSFVKRRAVSMTKWRGTRRNWKIISPRRLLLLAQLEKSRGNIQFLAAMSRRSMKRSQLVIDGGLTAA